MKIHILIKNKILVSPKDLNRVTEKNRAREEYSLILEAIGL